MEKFIVSARKYRPQNFATVVGQQHITTTLKNAIQHNSLAHAFLFCGPRGVGKTTCARILAKTINCENLQPDGEACNECPSCISFNEGASLNIHELDAASNNSVDDIRELVTQVRFAPQEGKYKIYIIDEVHMLSASAFNAFLKTLEEPPSYAKFILATTEKHKILPTILSRCQIFDFKRITGRDTVEHLHEIAVKEHINTEKAALQLIAQKSEGCMRDSLSLLDKIVSFTNGEVTYANTLEHLNVLDEDYYFKMLDALLNQDLAECLLLYDQINSKGFEGDTVLNGFAECLRNLMVSKDAKAAKLLAVLEGMQEKYRVTASKISLSFLVSALNVVAEAEAGFRISRNKRLHVELCLIKLCYLQQAIDLASSPDGQLLKKKRTDGPVAFRLQSVKPGAPQINLPEARLKVQEGEKNTPAKAENKDFAPPIPAVSQVQEAEPVLPKANLLVQTKVPAEIPTVQTSAGQAEKPRISLLEALKQKKQADIITRQEVVARQPNLEELQVLWDTFTATLKEKNKHSAVTSFQLAKISVNEDEVLISSVASINQKFIESEATALLEIFKKHFTNPEIRLAFRIQSDGAAEKPLEPRFLNSTERFKMMAKDFPLVKELKDRLKLDLSFG